MTAQTEFLWRLAIEVQELEDLSVDSPPESSERILAVQLRELYTHIEQLPASHALFNRWQKLRRFESVTSLLPHLMIVPEHHPGSEAKKHPGKD